MVAALVSLFPNCRGLSQAVSLRAADLNVTYAFPSGEKIHVKVEWIALNLTELAGRVSLSRSVLNLIQSRQTKISTFFLLIFFPL